MTAASRDGRYSSIRILLITGFLGSGKTTLIREILSWDTDLTGTTILVNDFGDIGIDVSMLANDRCDVVEMSNGCICCSLKNDFRTIISDIAGAPGISTIIIEASGIASPHTILDAIRESSTLDREFRITTVSIVETEMWDMRSDLGFVFLKQIEASGIIIINKIDECDSDTLQRVTHEINAIPGQRKVIPASYCHVNKEDIFTPVTISPATPSLRIVNNTTAHSPAYTTYSFTDNIIFNEDLLKKYILTLPDDIIRIKGYARTGDHAVFINLINGKGSWEHIGKPVDTKLVFIGNVINNEELSLHLSSCAEQHI